MVRVKICGITNLEDALAAIEYGADALGFVFAPSPRRVTPQQAKAIISELPPFVSKVGVFLNHELSEVEETMSFCKLDISQLHGNESPDYCAALSRPVIKTFTLRNLPSLLELKRYCVAGFMLDKEKGSTDTPQEQIWRIANEIRVAGPVILAGGLTTENVRQAIKAAQPYAVDVASGVEERPGKKDHKKIQAFIEAAK
jgi:phosphoribosylanthranilate isomerase